jgi:O-antigen/teichoic acid export membrane protein
MMSGSLGKIAKGAAIAFFGMLAFIFFEFITRVIVARYTTPSEYGTFCIGFALLNVFVLLSCLGLQGGATRCIAYFRGTGEREKVAGVVYSSLQLSIATGIFFFVVLFLSSDTLKGLLHLEQSVVLKLFATAIPFLVIVEILSAIFTGFGQVEKKVYFRDILMSLLKVSGIILAIMLGFGFLGVIYAYLFSTIITATLFAVYATKKLSIGELKEKALIRKKLFYFSTPLLFTSLSSIIIIRMDTLMLGYFKTSDIVGLYNAATPIAQLIPLILSSIALIYVPISSQLYSKNLIKELRRNYAILTKWIVAATLPLFLVIFLFPESVLDAVFGPSYVEAGTALRIIACGVFAQVFFGPNAATLIVIGKTKLNMVYDLIGATMNVSLNLFLIPTMGIIGAAIASAISLCIINVLKSAQIFRMYKIHPFTWNHIKPMIALTIFVGIIHLSVGPTHPALVLILFFFLFLAAYGVCLIITKSFDSDDAILFHEAKKKFRIYR